ncbi:Ada metal-binding domain-containing protein [Streptomyces buecherae]|uniref:Ada metal-binding domain-containing protein n=1 Tax=Streptomyces buecherae TaxID=2763006 RepID=UPI0037914C55
MTEPGGAGRDGAAAPPAHADGARRAGRAGPARAESERERFTLLDGNGRPYPSAVPGAFGGHRGGRLYGRLDCPSALRALARGGYRAQRVFFADAATARAAGYRPCAVCLPERYARWKAREEGGAAGVTGVTGPAPHTAAEVSALMDLLAAGRRPVRSLSIGHGRDAASRAAARAVAAAWCGDDRAERARHLREVGQHRAADVAARTVLDVVDWPEEAASWLRQARRLAAGAPDAWVVCGAPAGWARMARRLRQSTSWSAGRTFALASLGTPETVALAGAEILEGLRGASADGGHWEVRRGWITFHPLPSHP